MVFGWTDPFFQDDCLVDEWGFGLVDAERRPKPSYDVVESRFKRAVPSRQRSHGHESQWSSRCYNAATTLDECLSSLIKLDYPNYEVIVVNDGSTDQSRRNH